MWASFLPLVLLSIAAGVYIKLHSHASSAVPGQSYLVCDNPSQFLTSPYTYHALASGSQDYTVAQYQALPGYGTTLPALPTYISSQPASTEAAIIYAPGSTTGVPAWQLPESPVLHFFEGGAYGDIGFQSVSGDEFIGGSSAGFPEPTFNDGGGADGISGQNDSHSLGDGEAALATVKTSAAQGATTVALNASSIPLVQWGQIGINNDTYTIAAISGTQSSYTITITGGLDSAVTAGTGVYYAGLAGSVTVSYLDISHDLHDTTGTLYTGAGWTISHNKIHDSYSAADHGAGVAIYGGDQGVVEYNCLSKMGDYGINVFGTNNKFRMNEVTETNYEVDNSGNGQAGGGKWWGTLNADITDNAFINNSPGDSLVIWLDNGNSGTNISGNYFNKNSASALHSETGFNLSVTNNLFQDGGWGSGSGCGDSNCVGAVNINSSGGFHVPGSRYDNQIIISGNQFINNWGGIDIWQSGGRNCSNSGESFSNGLDSPYCSGGFPNTSNNTAANQYYFSHIGDTGHGGANYSLAQNATAGATTVLVNASVATNDQIGFADPAHTATTSTTNVSSLTGSQSINATSTANFPSSGQLRVVTSAAGAQYGTPGFDASWTGAILSYTGKTATSFTGVSLVRGSGTIDSYIEQVQPYKATSETCYANDCAVTITPALSSSVTAGADVANTGTCQLFATSAATPTNPIAPDGTTSYFDGCQWGTKNISVTGNTFIFDPTYIATHAPLNGGGTTTTCTAAHANSCGTNFQAFQEAGEPPFSSLINGNSMMSNSNLSTCPAWDSGCTTSPLKNINALSNTPSAPANNGEPSNNIVWSNNTYQGPWLWNVYWYGNCGTLPSDPNTSKSMPSPGCQEDFAHWQSNWQQDAGSTYSATVTSPTPSTSSSPTPTVSASPTPTGTPAGKIGDLNNDGAVNVFDLSILLSNWGTTNATADINHDSTVNIFDLSILLSHWGT